MLGVKEGHTIYCEETCSVIHHEVLVKLLLCKRNDMKTFEMFKQCIQNMVAHGWDVNSEIPDELEHFRFPLVHWAAVYGKLAVLKWMAEEKFDLAVTNTGGENAIHRLVACQAHERAVDTRANKMHGGRRYSLANITQIFSKVMNILTDTRPQMLLWYDFIERNTPIQLCLKLLNEAESQRLTLYHEGVFKMLCERLIDLVKKGKLSPEYVRNALALKDASGNTLWHIAAMSKSTKVVSVANVVMSTIKDIDLFVTNSDGDTPCMVALKNSFSQFASLVEEYKTPTLIIPMVKMETIPDISHCHCEPKVTMETQDDISLSIHDSLDRTSSSHIESSPAVNTPRMPSFCITDEQSFTEAPRNFTVIEQTKVVLTNPESVEVEKGEDIQQPINNATCGNVSECNLEVDGGIAMVTTKDCNMTGISDSSGQEDIVIEKQIDLVVNVAQSPDISPSSVNQEMGVVPGSEIRFGERTQEESTNEINDQASTMKNDSHYRSTVVTNHCSDETSSEISENLSNKTHSPLQPVSGNKQDLFQMESISQMHTPLSMDENVTKGVNLTPVLLIKLLSEPDVSEKFQSLLKDVITGDAEKVDSAQSILEKLSSSKARLDGEITTTKESLKDITTKKALLNEAISKLQLKLDVLRTSEDSTMLKISQLKKEHDDISEKMKECESTCNRLKRRLSDCTGALHGLSPKQQKIC